MPAAPFGPVQVIIALILAGALVFVFRQYNRTENKVMKYGMGGLAGAIIGVLGSYVLALAVLPFYCREGGYRFKFWALFVGLAMISIILGGLIAIVITGKQEKEESEEEKEESGVENED